MTRLICAPRKYWENKMSHIIWESYFIPRRRCRHPANRSPRIYSHRVEKIYVRVCVCVFVRACEKERKGEIVLHALSISPVILLTTKGNRFASARLAERELCKSRSDRISLNRSFWTHTSLTQRDLIYENVIFHRESLKVRAVDAVSPAQDCGVTSGRK